MLQSSRCRWILPFMWFLSLTMGTSPSRAGQAEVDRFLKEYPAAARKLARDLSLVHGRADVHEEFGDEEQRWQRVTFAVSGESYKSERAMLAAENGPTVRESVFVNGPDSGFRLARKAGEETYTLRSVHQGQGQSSDYVTSFGKFIEAPIGCVGTTFVEFLEIAKQEVISAEVVDFQGRECIEVVLPTLPVERPGRITILFDPALGWVARRCKAEVAGMPKPVVEFEVQYDEAKAPFPSQVDFKELADASRASFRAISPGPTDPEEFTLGHYGLGPVELPESGRPSRWPWYLLAGIGAVGAVVALVIRRIAA